MGMDQASRGDRPDIHLCGHPERGASDEVLMERIANGDVMSLRFLLERYWSPLVGYAGRIVGRREDAKDVVQEVFIRLWQKRQQWQPRGSVRAYIYRIARNLSLNACRERRTRKRRDEQSGIALMRGAPVRTPEEVLEAASLRAEVLAAINALPARRREIFVLSRLHGLTHREIAEAMGIARQTVSNQMTRAVADLRVALAHHLESCRTAFAARSSSAPGGEGP